MLSTYLTYYMANIEATSNCEKKTTPHNNAVPT